MAKTKSVTDTRQFVEYDRNYLVRKFSSIGVEEKLTAILESHDILTYYEKRLVKSVQKISGQFKTQESKKYFDQIIARDNLMINLRINIENNLLSNALSFWLKLDHPFEEICNKLLNEEFVKRIIDLLVKEFEELATELRIKERDSLAPEGFEGEISDRTEYPHTNPFNIFKP
jgi:hypothetical protein